MTIIPLDSYVLGLSLSGSEISCFTTCVVMKGCRANVRIVTPDDDNAVVDIDA